MTWVVDTRYVTAMTWVMFALMLFMTVPGTIFSPTTNAMIPEPNLFYRSLKLVLLAAGLCVTVWRHSLALLLLRDINRFFLAFLALVLASSLWSIEPAITLTRFVALCIVCLVCGSCVMVGWHNHRFQQLVLPFYTCLMIGSLIFGLMAPDLARETGTGISLQGAWKGLLGQKNGLGHASAIAVFFWVHGWLTRQVKLRWFLPGVAVSALCLILSRSSTSLFATLFSIILLVLLLRWPKQRRAYMAFVVALFVTIILLYSLAVLNIFPGLDFLLQPVIALTGKDLTFSGRTQIWAVIRAHISLHPVLGTGYAAYWIGPVPTSPSYVFINKYSNFYPTEAHNGYLDMINDLGYVGLFCLLGYLLVFLKQSLALLKIDYAQATLYLALLFEEMINNLSESDWLSSYAFSFVIMTLATFALARALFDHRWGGAAAVPPPEPVLRPQPRLRRATGLQPR
jgi:O-antigen ligase